MCLQELKSTDADFPVSALRRAGYDAVWRGQKTWNGVAILARGMEPVLTRNALPGDPEDDQSRYIEAAVNGVLIGCLYAPNGNPQPGPKFDYKLAWLEAPDRARGGAQGAKACRSCWPATTTSCRPSATSIRPSPTTRTRWCSRRAAPHSRACSSRAGPMRSARCIRTSASTRSGTTCETAGRATPACGSTIFCSARTLRRA